MGFVATVSGVGSFGATVDQQSALLATMAAIGPKGDKGDTGGTGATGPQGPQGIPGVIAATAPIQYDAPTQTVSIDPAYKPNPFDQSLNTTDSPWFETVYAGVGGFSFGGIGGLTQTQLTLSSGGAGMIITDGSITFSDATVQTTAAVFYDQSLNTTDSPQFSEATVSTLYVSGSGIGNKIVFPDNTEQTTAGLSPASAAATYGERVDIQTFGSPTSSGTFSWSKPAGAKMVQVRIFGAGSGGTGGSCDTTANTRNGGGGGAGGASSMMFIPASELGATVTVTVAAGGAGGAGRSTAGNPGLGANGGFSAFGNYRANGGQAPVSVTAGGNAVPGTVLGLVNSLGSTSGGAGGVSPAAAASIITGQFSPTGGGGGAGAAAGSTTNNNGQSGGSRTNGTSPGQYNATLAGGAGGTSGGTPATNGTNQDVTFAAGTGGGGGFYRTGQNGGNGGNGGWPGGGGGGGGASDVGFASGTGGTGGNGMVTVITYF